MHKHGFCCTKVEKLSVTAGNQTLLRDVSFHLHCGETTVVIGRNGAGKTSLLRALLGELRYTGSISFHSYKGAAHSDGANRRLRIGYVPQHLPVDPGGPVSVYDLCAALSSRKPVFLIRDRVLRERLRGHLENFGAGALLDRRLANLSGGEWQRVMLAVATDPPPDLLILDEPVAGVDRVGMMLLYEKLNALKVEEDMSLLMVSHDFSLLSHYADRVVLLDGGAVLSQGTPGEVLTSSAFASVFGPMREAGA